MNISKYNHDSSQSLHSSARTLHWQAAVPPLHDSSGSRPVWNTSSLMSFLPESPSPICSGCSSTQDSTSCSLLSETSDSQPSIELSPARNQSSCTVTSDSKSSPSRNKVDKWIENAKSCGCFRRPHLQNDLFIAPKHGVLLGLTSPSRRGGSIPEELSNLARANSIHKASEAGSLNDGGQRLPSPLEPYHALLDEVNRRNLEAEIAARKKAEYLKLVDKLERKEAAIDDWEFKKTKTAMEEMKKIERKLERKRLQALEKTERRISRAKIEANKKKSKARRSTIEEITAVSKFLEKIRATRSSLQQKLRKFC